jgi:DNA-binding transcriptional ArsR family regulator
LKALAHPVRVKVLESMSRGHRTAKEVAEDLGQPLAAVSHHIRILVELDCIEIVETRQKRGAIQYIYRPNARGREFSDGEWDDLPPAAREGLSGDWVSEVVDAMRASLAEGAFDRRTDRTWVALELTLDEEGWREVNTILLETFDRVQEVQARAADVPPDEAIRSRALLVQFERATEDA